MPDDTILRRAYEELALDPMTPKTEGFAIALDYRAKAHSVEARKHIYCLAPLFALVREEQLYSKHPERFQSFEQWLKQPEIDVSLAQATDMINWWKYAVPVLKEAGIDPEKQVEAISPSKLRLLVSPIKEGIDRGRPMPQSDVVDLVQAAQTYTWEDLRRHIRPLSSHEPKPDDNPDYDPSPGIEEPPYIQLHIKPLGSGKYQVAGTFSAAEMAFIERHLQPVWVDGSGQIVRLGRIAS